MNFKGRKICFRSAVLASAVVSQRYLLAQKYLKAKASSSNPGSFYSTNRANYCPSLNAQSAQILVPQARSIACLREYRRMSLLARSSDLSSAIPTLVSILAIQAMYKLKSKPGSAFMGVVLMAPHLDEGDPQDKLDIELPTAWLAAAPNAVSN